MSPIDSWKWIDSEMTKVFPLGLIKNTTAIGEATEAENAD